MKHHWDSTITPGFVILLITIVFIGGLVRFYPVRMADFPINDGGLFYVMTQDLQSNDYRLPWYTTYNSASIPYVYPPLGFYIAGILNDSLNIELIQIFRFLPLILTILTIPAFYLLACEVFCGSVARLFSLLAFIFIPDSFRWLIMGGGITRALGMLLALLALVYCLRLYKNKTKLFSLPAILFCGLTVLSHPPTALFLVYSIGIFFLFFNRTRQGLLQSLILLVGTLLVIAPWSYFVIDRHGVSTILRGSSSGEPFLNNFLRFLLFKLSNEPYIPVWTMIGLSGFFLGLFRKQLFLPGWLLSVYVLQTRATAHVASIPLALLAGIGGEEIILYYTKSTLKPVLKKTFGLTLFTMVVIYSLIMVNLAPPQLTSALPAGEREAMKWVSTNTALNSSLLVISGVDWFVDRSSEWMPVLANRTSVSLVQGYEWLDGFGDRIDRHDKLQECTTQAPDCIENWVHEHKQYFTHIYIPKPCLDLILSKKDKCSALRAILITDLRYRLVYEGEGASIYERVQSFSP